LHGLNRDLSLRVWTNTDALNTPINVIEGNITGNAKGFKASVIHVFRPKEM
jgi:hypothetical protein